jgi:hypothetical protein
VPVYDAVCRDPMAFGPAHADLSLLAPGPLNNTVILSKRCNGVCPF